MKSNQEKPASILADIKVFDYLKEKTGDRKTKTEAYCDLLNKSLAGFVSPFLKEAGLRTTALPVPCDRFRPCRRGGTGIALLSAHFWTRSNHSDNWNVPG